MKRNVLCFSRCTLSAITLSLSSVSCAHKLISPISGQTSLITLQTLLNIPLVLVVVNKLNLWSSHFSDGFVDIQVNPLRGVSWFQGVRVSEVQKICSEANVKYLRIYLSVALQDTPVSFTQIYQYNSINILTRSTVTCPSILPVYFSSLVVQITNCNEHTTLPLRDVTKCFFNVFLTMNFYDESHREH